MELPVLLILLFTFAFGNIIGSFLSVVIFRVPEGESIVWGRSMCPKCHTSLRARDLIPIISYCLLRGRCSSCRDKVSAIYPIIETTTGLLFILAFYMAFIWQSSPPLLATVTFIYLLVLFSIFVALTFIDIFYLLLLDVLVFPALLLTMVYHFATYFIASSLGTPLLPTPYSLPPVLLGYAFGLGVALFFAFLIWITRGKGMGWGDVKYALVLGAVAGWPGAIVGLFFAFVSGAIISLGLIAFGKKGFKQVIPFGPFLIAGTIFAMLFGQRLVDMYLLLP